MIAEIITIGNEILDGRVVDTNRVYLAQNLKERGYEVRFAQSVDDNIERIVDAFALAVSRSDAVFCTGGLGPTSDDMTIESFAKFLGVENPVNADAENFVKKIVESRGRSMNESQLKQARVPTGCDWIENPAGTAPGVFFKGMIQKKSVEFYFFPGVPRELTALFSKIFDQKKTNASYKSYTWSTQFSFESELQEQLKEIEKTIILKSLPFKIGFRTHFPENHVSLMGTPTKEYEHEWETIKNLIHQELSSQCYAWGESVSSFEEILLKELNEHHAKILLVESSTGGLISHLLTEVAGASSVLWGSQVCYANQEKLQLGVSDSVISSYGAVSKQCAQEMANSGLKRLEKTVPPSGTEYILSASVTGIAGPGGATASKPVGLFCVGLAFVNRAQTQTLNIAHEFKGPPHLDRQRMKIYMARKTLEFMRVNFLNFIKNK